MTKIAMAVDLDMCTGCFACQNACKMVNSLDDDVKWLKVIPELCQPEEVHGELYMDRFPVPVTLEVCIACPDRKDGSDPLCCTICMGKALHVGDPSEVQAWADGKRSVVYSS